MPSHDEVTAELSPAEAELIEAAQDGRPSVFDPSDDRTTIRAEVLRALMCGGLGDWKARGTLEVHGGNVHGQIDLQGAEVPAPVRFVDVHFDAPVVLSGAKTCDIDLSGSVLPALLGERLHCDGDLVLERAQIDGGVRLKDAVVTGSIRCSKALLSSASGPGFVLDDARVVRDVDCVAAEVHGSGGEPALVGRRLIVDGDALLMDVVADAVDLEWAELHTLRCTGARLAGVHGLALRGDGMRVDRGVFLNRGFRAQATVSLLEADAGDELNCTGGTFECPAGHALDGKRLTVRRIYFDHGFRATGAVSLDRAIVAEHLTCTGGTFSNDAGAAILADGLACDGDVYLNKGVEGRFRASGTVSLIGASIGRQLNCTGGRFEGVPAILADGLACRDVYFNAAPEIAGDDPGDHQPSDGDEVRFHATGSVSLNGATIGRQLNCTGGKLDANRADAALAGKSLRCSGTVYLNDGFHAVGKVSLVQALIEKRLECTGGRFESAGHPETGRDTRPIALDASGLNCHGDVLLDGRAPGQFLSHAPTSVSDEGFCADGTVQLEHGRISGDLRCEGGRFRVVEGWAVAARGLSVDGTLVWKPREVPNGRTDFTDASLGRLEDHPDSWPSGKGSDGRSLTTVQGLTFESCTPWTADERKSWLRCADFAPQVYEQLARIYRQTGQESDAVDLDMARLREFRSRGGASLPRRVWNWFLEQSVGYGYWLHRPVVALLLLGLLGSVIFNYAQHHDIMSPASSATSDSINANDCTANYPCFNPYVYSFELLLPVVNLRQVTYWIPNVNADWGLAVAAYFWFAILIGWVIAAALVAGIGRVVNRS